MFLTSAVKDLALDHVFPTGTGTDRCYLGAFTQYSEDGTTGLHGSKVAGTWASSSSGSKAISGTVNLTITGAVTVKWIGVFGGTTGGTIKAMVPNGSTGDKSFQVDTTANERIYCEGHGWSADQKIVFHGGTWSGGPTIGTTYYVKAVTAGDPDYFTFSDTVGGTTFNMTGLPSAGVVVSNITEEIYAAGGTHSVTALTIAI